MYRTNIQVGDSIFISLILVPLDFCYVKKQVESKGVHKACSTMLYLRENALLFTRLREAKESNVF